MFLITQDIWMIQKEKVMGMITSAEVICVRKVLYVYTKYIYRRRINTKGKANVVATVWGIEFIRFIAALVILH